MTHDGHECYEYVLAISIQLLAGTISYTRNVDNPVLLPGHDPQAQPPELAEQRYTRSQGLFCCLAWI